MMFTPTENGPDQIRRNRRVTGIIGFFAILISIGIVAAYLLLMT